MHQCIVRMLMDYGRESRIIDGQIVMGFGEGLKSVAAVSWRRAQASDAVNG